MVGYDPSEGKTLPNYYYGAAGALSGIVTRAVAQPLDVLKIRFQLQVEPIKKGGCSKYNGMIHACGLIMREEGPTAFWKGHVPAQFLSISYGVVQFTAFEVLSKKAYSLLPSKLYTDLRPVIHFTCGSMGGTLATLAAQPFDVIRTRFVAQGKQKVYSSMLHAGRSMLQVEGFRSLYKGLTPTLLQIAPYSGFQFGFYAIFNAIWRKIRGLSLSSRADPMQSLVCGSMSGFCSKLAVYPLDMVKKRLQVQGFEHGRAAFGRTHQYSGLIHCFRTIVATEGTLGLYKGLGPSIVKAIVTTAISFAVYEQFVNVFKFLKHR